jgi:hypothetical protein
MRVSLYPLISGMMATGYFVAGLFFLRFWRDTSDRLFLYFAAAFGLLGVQRIIAIVAMEWTENVLWVYGIRLVAFLLILYAIIDKNRPPPSPRPTRANP